MLPKNLAAILLLAPALAAAQSSSQPVVQDNSFLMEEAYNQEAGVVQHILTLRTFRGSSDFDGAFTQEWPVGSIRHQLSYDLPLVRFGEETGIGDIGVNYRYQLIGSGETQLAISPRFSVSLPTGDWKKGRGAGAVGFEAGVPLSYVISPLFTAHTNVDGGFTPSARNPSGARASSFGFTLGQSLIFTPNQRFQPLVEVLYSREQEVVAEDKTEWSDDLVVSPGVRAAFNFASGLQIVPGFAVPFGRHGERGMFFYLSFEHPFRHR
jgi:hypothetical protein